MASEWEIKIPVKGKSEGNGNSRGNSGFFGKLAAAVGVGNMASKAASVVMEGLIKTLEPLINILKALFVVVFLPLMPLITELTKIIAELVPGMLKLFNGEINIVEFMKSILIPAIFDIYRAFIKFNIDVWVAIGKALWDVLKWLGDLIADAGKWVGDKIVQAFEWVVNIGTAIWEWFVSGFESVKEFGLWVWDIFVSGLSAIADFGAKIWEIIKMPFQWLADKVGSVVDWIVESLPSWLSGKREMGGPVSSGGTYLVGEKGPELFTPSSNGNITSNDKLGSGGSVTINVTGNKFNSDTDMRKMVDMISTELSKQRNRSYT